MTEPRGVTIFVPALNEEKNLTSTVESIVAAAKAAGNVPIDVVIVNDGSTDGSVAVIKELEKKYDVVRAIHHQTNMGPGVSFREAVESARYAKIALFPGDGMVSAITLRDMIRDAYSADFVCAFIMNTECRTKFRRLLSSIYTFIYVCTFNIPLRYINATPVYPVELLRKLKLNCRRYSFPSEVNVKVLRSGIRFLEIPGFLNPNNMTSSAVRLRNFIEVVLGYFLLISDIYVSSRKTYARVPVRIQPASLDLRDVD
jgi:glycosyltransferase involved in cell wall biosynthesis